MPKQKSHRGLAKRIKKTGSGKLMHRRAGRGHYRLAKGKNRFRRLDGTDGLSPGDERIVRRMTRN
ncbi:MAG: 50S ribosomal protein L35 [Actinomycetia bacterium]|nr:50S ribosomal protein L35 [Actinomycetes bacterium]